MGEDEDRIAALVEERLAVARRDLERDFDVRRREAKQQERRGRDRLEEDRAAWEVQRREERKVLADEKEALRRRRESAQKEADLKQKARAELVSAKHGLDKEREDGEMAREELARQVAELQGRLAKAQSNGLASRLLLAAMGAGLFVWSLVWVHSWWAYSLGGAALIIAGILHLQVRRL